MRTSEAFSALFADQFEHGDVVVGGRFTDAGRAWARVALLRTAIENATTADHPSDVFDAAHELTEIVGVMLVHGVPDAPAVAA